MSRASAFVAVAPVGTVAGQMVLKYAIERHGQVPKDLAGVTSFLGRSLADPLELLSMALAFGAALTWIAVMSRPSLASAYAFMSLAFVGTALFSALLLGESIGVMRWGGIGVVVVGSMMVAKG